MGEDFDIDIKARGLRQRGHQVGSDLECLLRRYEEVGSRSIAEINGRFAGVVVDLRAEKVILFNDRFGLNRIYVHESPHGLYFSSEAKSLLAVLPSSRCIVPQSLAEFLSVGCVLQHRSLFEGILLLPPSSLWTFRLDGTVRKETYFDRTSWEEQSPLHPVEYSRALTEVFGRVAPKYLRGSARVGMSLTGGLDSRMILAWLRLEPDSLPCYTFGGPYRDCADVQIARQLAAVARQSHSTLRIEPDFFRDFSQLAERTVDSTDGTMDVSGAVELYVNNRARQIAPVRLTGNYGSEVLRSNVAFRPSRLDASMFTPEFRPLLEQAAETYRQEATGHRLSFIVFKQVPWHHFSRFAAERSQLTPRSPFLDHELVALAYRAPRQLEGSPHPLLELIRRGNPAMESVRTDRALHLRPGGLRKLQHQWQEFTARAEYAYDYGMPSWLARADRALKPLHLERLILGRHKFYHFRVWYRDQLRHAVTNQINSSRLPPCYIEATARNLINEHTSGKRNRTVELHKLLTVQLIDRLLISISCRS